MKHIEPKDLSVRDVHRLLLGGVAPRPIALVSTISADGIPNLSPFSFFNAFGANPPIVAFSPNRRGRDGTLKDTYNNIVTTKECVINAVTYQMVEQISLASAEFAPEINEFEKSGLTPVKSDIVKPARVQQSPFQMECILREMVTFGDKGASANIAICEVIKFHVAEDLFSDGIIQPDFIDLVARMSGDFYCRASGSAVFQIEKPEMKKCIGVDSLPAYIRQSHTYSANNLGKFGNAEKLPDQYEAEKFISDFLNSYKQTEEPSEDLFHRMERQGRYEDMLFIALKLAKEKHPRGKYFLELTAKCALENNNPEFSLNTAVYTGSSYE